MWIVGGDVNQGHYHSDVWNSSDGKSWTFVNADRPVLVTVTTYRRVSPWVAVPLPSGSASRNPVLTTVCATARSSLVTTRSGRAVPVPRMRVRMGGIFAAAYACALVTAALAFLLTKAGVDNVVLGTDLPCDMATPAPWAELVAVAGEVRKLDMIALLDR